MSYHMDNENVRDTSEALWQLDQETAAGAAPGTNTKGKPRHLWVHTIMRGLLSAVSTLAASAENVYQGFWGLFLAVGGAYTALHHQA